MVAVSEPLVVVVDRLIVVVVDRPAVPNLNLLSILRENSFLRQFLRLSPLHLLIVNRANWHPELLPSCRVVGLFPSRNLGRLS